MNLSIQILLSNLKFALEPIYQRLNKLCFFLTSLFQILQQRRHETLQRHRPNIVSKHISRYLLNKPSNETPQYLHIYKDKVSVQNKYPTSPAMFLPTSKTLSNTPHTQHYKITQQFVKPYTLYLTNLKLTRQRHSTSVNSEI